MSSLVKLGDGIDVSALMAQIDAQPDLWGANPERTSASASPHAQSQDIWLRFRARGELVLPQHYTEPHFASFYPAWWALPAAHSIVFGMMHFVRAVYLGGIMLTKLPPGGRILPHTDDGWHAGFMNTKLYVILKANEGCRNYCGDEVAIMRPGEAWQFRNDITHSVENDGDGDRIAMIITMRVEGGPA